LKWESTFKYHKNVDGVRERKVVTCQGNSCDSLVPSLVCAL
jgi:hypothetical protein